MTSLADLFAAFDADLPLPRAERDARRDPTSHAREIVVDVEGTRGTLVIDGVEFPWHTSLDYPMEVLVEGSKDELAVVRIAIVADAALYGSTPQGRAIRGESE